MSNAGEEKKIWHIDKIFKILLLITTQICVNLCKGILEKQKLNFYLMFQYSISTFHVKLCEMSVFKKEGKVKTFEDKAAVPLF